MEKMQIPQRLATALSGAGGPDLRSMTPIELARWRADRCNLERGALEGYDCPECLNRGYFHRVDELGRSYLEECRCMVVRRNRDRIRRSGLADMLGRYTMEAWQTREPWQVRAKELAERYAASPAGWFLAAGPPGTGKTHLCTALCGLLMDRGVDLRYMLWRDVSVRAKACVGDEAEYRKLLEPLKCLFKDEVREVGRQLGLPEHVIRRQPFPGPGLGVRHLGAVTRETLDILREADAIMVEEVKAAGMYYRVWQTFAIFIPMRTVGVMGDQRTYEYIIALRAVESQDGMTADWVDIPHDLMQRISSRIVNEVKGVNRVVYDVTSKPPSTIEWE